MGERMEDQSGIDERETWLRSLAPRVELVARMALRLRLFSPCKRTVISIESSEPMALSSSTSWSRLIDRSAMSTSIVMMKRPSMTRWSMFSMLTLWLARYVETRATIPFWSRPMMEMTAGLAAGITAPYRTTPLSGATFRLGQATHGVSQPRGPRYQ